MDCKRRKRLYLSVCGILFWLTSCVFLLNLNAEAPANITYQGRLSEYGQPVTGARTMKFTVYRDSGGSQFVWSSGDQSITVTNGIFSADLAPDVDWTGRDYWIETMISGKTLLPREKITPQVYALHAQNAENIKSTTTVSVTIGSTRRLTVQSTGEVSSLIGGTTYYMVPRGAIIMWSGTIASIPSGWALCDGNSGTPDLRDRFVVGARQDDGGIAKTNIEGSLLQTGGAKTHQHTVYDHSHTFSGTTIGPSGSGTAQWPSTPTSVATADHTHYYSGATGGASPLTNSPYHIPPYFALAFIMKI